MRMIEFIIEIKENIDNSCSDIVDIMYIIGRVIGWISLFLIGYAGGSIVRGLLQGFGII